MRISSLSIRNIRNIDSAEVSDLGNIVVVVGPNGSGKTTIIEAIRLFKSTFGRYSRRSGYDYQRLFPEIITVGQEEAEISLQIELEESEQKHLVSTIMDGFLQQQNQSLRQLEFQHERGQITRERLEQQRETLSQQRKQRQQALQVPGKVLKGTVIANRQSARAIGDTQHLSVLFSSKAFEEGLGIIEHIPSNRQFAAVQVSNLQFSEGYIQQERHRVIEDTSQKFSNFKEDLVRMAFMDATATHEEVEPHPRYMEGIRGIFSHFIEGAKFEGVDSDVYMSRPPRIEISNVHGRHEIDHLSSGQKEVLMTYALLEKRKHTNSVVLLDEPELHLNGALEKKVLPYVRQLTQHGNQVWLFTHSPEIIGSCESETVLRISGGKPNVIQPINLEDEQIRTLKELGATVHLQMISRKIIYVEGESDVEILNHFSPGLSTEVGFIESGGSRGVNRAVDLLNRASAYENFFGIIDLDFMDNEERQSRMQAANGKLHVWSRYHIENFLLDAEALYQALQALSSAVITSFKGANEVEGELKRIADSLQQLVIARKIESIVNPDVTRLVRIDPDDPTGSLATAAERKLKKLTQLFEPANRQQVVKEAQQKIKSEWQTKWEVLCPGREILKEFCRCHMKSGLAATYSLLKQHTAQNLKDKGEPEEVRQVIAKIKA